ncbi:hypothetical protein [Pseudomonas synxantha]|jgi:hypothetical protein|uniref:hypothetical protein n=1 Tax=Pseudomonas synxantha TaxID=47883 RepID=UPI00099D1866|nr:hypothetical protein [Pseudomonas synxantha]
MNGSLPLAYTNQVSPEFLRNLDKFPFTERQLASFEEQALAIVNQQRSYAKAHPPIAIYRVVTAGSQTRNGGVIQHATAPMEFTLDNGEQVRAAQKGDYVVYSDGSKAKIITASGEGNSHVALVGSHLSNGDEIINTPQSGLLCIARQGVALADDFLPVIED